MREPIGVAHNTTGGNRVLAKLFDQPRGKIGEAVIKSNHVDKDLEFCRRKKLLNRALPTLNHSLGDGA
jgi:hypothetical protein